MDFDLSNGGVTVQYYLAQILDLYGEKVRIYSNNIIHNSLFNNYYGDDFNLDETVIIYCEGVIGNPLNGKYVVRWLLSELGKNVSNEIYLSWNKNNLVYYFNSELKFNNDSTKIGNYYKNLSLLYIYENIKNNNKTRYGYCHTFRKSIYHINVKYIHPEDSFEINRNHSQDDYIIFFNRHEYFISYDPLTFLNVIASLCGCISIVYPIEGLSKKEWFKTTALSNYLIENNIDYLYGIAYGNDEAEINYAKSTIHLLDEQFKNIIEYFKNKSVIPFINDINNWDNSENTVENNFYIN